MHELGKRVKMLRSKKGWTQTKLAKKLGIRYMNIANLETGRIKNPRYLSSLASILDTSVSFLMDGVSPNKIEVETPIYLASISEQIFFDPNKDYWVVEIDKKNKLSLEDGTKKVGKIKRVFN
tara:strand:- start:179 stop:544 length:366 start_codon:yes stop_codon:yes gene_type:complete